MRIIVNGGEHVIFATEDNDPEKALEAHGVDPEAVEYSLQKGLRSRLNDLEAAAGVGSKGPQKGIAHRIDDLESRVEALESEHS